VEPEYCDTSYGLPPSDIPGRIYLGIPVHQPDIALSTGNFPFLKADVLYIIKFKITKADKIRCRRAGNSPNSVEITVSINYKLFAVQIFCNL